MNQTRIVVVMNYTDHYFIGVNERVYILSVADARLIFLSIYNTINLNF